MMCDVPVSLQVIKANKQTSGCRETSVLYLRVGGPDGATRTSARCTAAVVESEESQEHSWCCEARGCGQSYGVWIMLGSCK